METFNVFTILDQAIEPAFLNAVNGVTDQLLSAVASVLPAVLALYVAMHGYLIATGRSRQPVADVWWTLVRGAAVAAIASAGVYDHYVRDFFLTGLPNDVVNAITGATGGDAVGAAAFDHIWNRAIAGAMTTWKNLSWTDFGLQVLIVVYWFAAGVSTAFGFLVWLVSHILLGLFVAVGALVVPMFMFPSTRSIFERWVGAMLSMVFLQAFVALLLTVMIATENQLLAPISVGIANPMMQVTALMGAVVLFVICAVVVVQLPGAAAALSGGLHFHAHQLGRATFGQAVNLGNRLMSGAASADRKATGAVMSRLSRAKPTPGPSMSSSKAT